MDPFNMSIKVQPTYSPGELHEPVDTKRHKGWLVEATAYVTPQYGSGEVVTAVGLVEHRDKMRAIEFAVAECETHVSEIRNGNLEA